MIEPSEHRPSQVIVDLAAIRHNINYIKSKLSPEQKIYAVVKANGYGHGSTKVAQVALEEGCQGFAVATVDEAIELRKSGFVQPILVMGLTDPMGIGELLIYNITVTVSDIDFFQKAYQQLESKGNLVLLDTYKLKFHLALDTGMGRIGLTETAELIDFAQKIKNYPWADWEGVFTHFATASGGPAEYIDRQWNKWQGFLEYVPESVTERHYANSAMVLWHNDRIPQSTIVRFGIGMYGLDPMDRLPEGDWESEQKEFAPDQLKPALELASELVYVKKLKKGSSISYGATYTCPDDEWIGTVPIGYGDGWLRHYQSTPLLIHGHKCPVVGRINMDQLMVKLPYKMPVGTQVTLIGQNGHLENHACQIAQNSNTISYEVVTTLNRRLPRVYLDSK